MKSTDPELVQNTIEDLIYFQFLTCWLLHNKTWFLSNSLESLTLDAENLKNTKAYAYRQKNVASLFLKNIAYIL